MQLTLIINKVIINIDYFAAKHKNQPPVAEILPPSQTVKLPSSTVIFDGSGSTDDEKIVSYQWELLMGPLGYNLEDATSPTLQMADPVPGNYTIM